MSKTKADMMDQLQRIYIRKHLEAMALEAVEACSNVSGHSQELVFKMVDGKITEAEVHYREFGSSVLSCKKIDLL